MTTSAGRVGETIELTCLITEFGDCEYLSTFPEESVTDAHKPLILRRLLPSIKMVSRFKNGWKSATVVYAARSSKLP